MYQQRLLQTTRPVITAHITQTMVYLNPSVEEMRQRIEAEISSNPALEIADIFTCPKCGQPISPKGFCMKCAMKNELGDLVVFSYSQNNTHYASDHGQYAELEDMVCEPHNQVSLTEYVLNQISHELDPKLLNVANHLLSGVDEDGILGIDSFEVARYHFISIEKVHEIILKLQQCDPIGVCSPSPREAMLAQLISLEGDDHNDQESIASARFILENSYEDLITHNLKNIRKNTGLTEEQINSSIHFIALNLNPYPARTFWGNVQHGFSQKPQVYYQPDVIISPLRNRNDGGLKVEIVSPVWGTLQVNPEFQAAVKNASKEEREKCDLDIERAILIAKCVKQRNQTIANLMTILTQVQKQYILHGDTHLIPITRAEIAQEMGVHESTVSRAVANKQVQLPNGKIIPMHLFFDRSRAIRTVLKEIIHKETKPLSDNQLSKVLAKLGHQVKRRTVAKYRIREGILPARLRNIQMQAKNVAK